MSEHLIRAAKARHDETTTRATKALLEMAKIGEPITFAAVARRAGISTDFLYNNPDLRSRITDLRGQPHARQGPPPPNTASSTTTAVRALSAQLKQERRRHHEELTAVRKALAAAHGENLALRRLLAQHQG